ncbi:solute carrier family 15 member 1-like isoform X1 [Brachionus plicatilis]|uniref:Solute carrier family 15 member 1-like isoform X1 n=1 Tax=Brachionus plicatilis TaxID=10195 RepID=A0A3M7SSC5_BRAPC|nr:solute carrier family 15 member 1-like isoform X1 [Brachionus plicatilis]
MDENSIDEKQIKFELSDSNGSNLPEKLDNEIMNEKNKYPKTVFLIILNEFCERFSYYGIRTVLFLYLTNFIKIEQHSATAIYHAFTVICYFTPILGAILADGYLGLYKTILYVSIVYCIGEIILTLTSIIPLGAPNITGPAIALFIIAVGTGGIKPCVSAFGGNQFHPSQKKYLATFFSVFYLSINVGSTIGTILTPIFRNDVKCFGQDCYPLAFGVPAVVMVASIIIYAIGTPFYNRSDETNKKGSNIIIQTADCIFTGIKNKIKFRNIEKKEHWLDYADTKFNKQMIFDVKAFYKIVVVFLPLPIFWALYDQQGSRWTAQAQQLNGKLGKWMIKPDQFQAVNPIFIVALVPLFDFVIYPFFSKFNILKKELHRMSIGLIFAILSFGIAALLESRMQATLKSLNPSNRIRLVNLSPCDITFFDQDETLFYLAKSIKVIDMPEDKRKKIDQKKSLLTNSTCLVGKEKFNFSNTLDISDLNASKNLFFYLSDNMIKTLDILINQNNQVNGFSQIRFLKFGTSNFGAVFPKVFNNIISYGNEKFDEMNNSSYLSTNRNLDVAYTTIDYSDYRISIRNSSMELLSFEITFETCARYSILLYPNPIESHQIDYLILTDIYPNGLHLCWQLIQILIMTVGEVMFSISGISFAYSQAPSSMKSVIQALWCLTVAFGNLIVVIVAEAKFVENQVYEYFIFMGLLTLATGIFIFLSCRYKYSDKSDDNSSDVKTESSFDPTEPLKHSAHVKYSTDSEIKLISLSALEAN